MCNKNETVTYKKIIENTSSDVMDKLSKICIENNKIDTSLYGKYDVKRGLRDINGNGVLAGLTNISNIQSKKNTKEGLVPCDGILKYRGINIRDLCKGFVKDKRFGFEEATYLVLFGKLPNKSELYEFKNLLAKNRKLPDKFVRDVIMKLPSKNMMNTLSRSVLSLYNYDNHADNTSINNVLMQSIKLISVLPMLTVYGYHAYNHYVCKNSMYVHKPDPNLSTAENILRLLRPDMKYTKLEAQILDLALVLHIEHGGGNNSSFTTHVVTSTGTDTYSVMAAALGSLKGPKHGGANIKVVQMFEDMKSKISNKNDDDEIRRYLERILDKEEFDGKGLIYGMGHAVYSVSDPRAEIFKSFVQKLAIEKGMEDEYNLYSKVESIAKEVIKNKRKIYKGVSANVDFYSGFVYSMLNIPLEIFTPIFACARIVGWCAHRLEELINTDKIIRPAYMSILDSTDYLNLEER